MKDLTPLEKTGVREMVASFMRPQQGIIICVTSGTSDVANRAVFDMASEYDPAHERTIGVITKCDITQRKDELVSLAQNQDIVLYHGCRIKKTFPSILVTVRTCRAIAQSELEKLGAPRNLVEEIRAYLAELTQQIHMNTSQILIGKYHGKSSERVKLRRFLQEASDGFAKKMVDQGHCVPFQALPAQGNAIDRQWMFEAPIGLSLFKGGFENDLGFGMHGGSSSKAAYNDVNHHTPITSGLHCFPKVLPISNGAFGSYWEYQQTLCASEPWCHFSFEELRFKDYSYRPAQRVGGCSGFPEQTTHNPFGSGLPGTDTSTAPKLENGGVSSAEPDGLSTSKHVTKGSIFNPPNPSTTLIPNHGGFSFTKSDSPSTSKEETRSSGYNPFSRVTGGKNFFGDNAYTTPKPTGLGASFPRSIWPSTSIFGSRFTSVESAFHAQSQADPYHPTIATPLNQMARVGSRTTLGTLAAPDDRSSEVYKWIREEIQNCRATELQRTLTLDVLPALFHRQTTQWRDIATSYIRSVAYLTMGTLQGLVSSTCKDTTTAQKLMTRVEEANQKSKARGLKQVHQRAEEIACRRLQTRNPLFEKNVREARLVRFVAGLKRYQQRNLFRNSGLPHQITLDLHDVPSLFNDIHLSNVHNLEDEIHDTLKVYYDLAVHEFIEYVMQVVESYLNDPEGPIPVLKPTYIASMTEDEIKELGAEDEGIASNRAKSQATLTKLKRAEETILKHI
ncbi:MAG: hypothetical protein Q9218_003205 [Villophora microphyllina]